MNDFSRLFFCAWCRAQQPGATIPAGWYSLMRSNGPEDRGQRLGLWCSEKCLSGWLALRMTAQGT